MESSKDKDLVALSYNEIASSYNKWATSKTSPRDAYLEKVLARISRSSRILELGCGGGLPVTKSLLQYVHGNRGTAGAAGSVVANDISSQQITMAKENAPGAEYICGDMMTLAFPNESLDAVVAFFSIFHLSRDEQPAIFRLVSDWLKPGGWMAISLGTTDKADIKNDFFGKEMYWSSFGVEENQKMLENAGLEVVEAEILDASDDPDDPDYGIKFWWALATKSELSRVK